VSALPGLDPPKPIPLKERASIVFVQKGQVDVKDGAFVVIDKDGVRTHLPVGGVACIMLEPGIRISHAAVALAARKPIRSLLTSAAGARIYSILAPRRIWSLMAPGGVLRFPALTLPRPGAIGADP
jgi:CRISPR-associated protein Cas1